MKVSLIGDSIRMQYEPRVRELLGDCYEVFGPEENCRFSKYTLRGLWDWSDGIRGSRIIHWNNGLWDICSIFEDGKIFTSEEEYVENMLRIADLMLNRCDKLIFATTTPVSKMNPYNKNEHIKRYNDILVPKLIEKGVIINDLYSLIAVDVDRYICEDNIHLSPEGVELCARQVADFILSAAATLDDKICNSNCDIKLDKTGAPILI